MTRRMKISISIVVVSIFVLWHISMPVTRMFTNYYYDKGTSAAVEEVKTLEEREARDQREGQAMQRANFFGRIWDKLNVLPYRSAIWVLLTALLVVSFYELGAKWTLWTALLSWLVPNAIAWAFVGLVTLVASDFISVGLAGDTYRISILLIGKNMLRAFGAAFAVCCVPILCRRWKKMYSAE